MTVKFYLITLDDRRHISETNASVINNALGKAIIIPGYNPESITTSELEDYASSYILRYGKKPLLNQLACLRAHIGAMKAFLDSGDEFCVIGEDDFEITNVNLISDCLARYNPKEREILNFGGFQGLPLESMRVLDKKSYVRSRHLKFVHMMALYCVNREFATKYVLEVERAGVNNDDWASLKDMDLYLNLRVFPAIRHGGLESILDPEALRGYEDKLLAVKVLAHNLWNCHLRKPV